MAWYKIPKIKVDYLWDEDKEQKTGVSIAPKDWEKLVEKMEDFIDHADITEIKKKKQIFYSSETIHKMLRSKT